MRGVDLMEDRIEKATSRYPEATFLVGSAHQLPFPDESFDLVCQSTLMSSILDDDVLRQVATEMSRVLRPGGHILWYDFWLNPTNPQARGIRLGMIHSLFTGFAISNRQVTLAAPLSRRLSPRFPGFCHVLESLQPLRTHHLAVMTKRG